MTAVLCFALTALASEPPIVNEPPVVCSIDVNNPNLTLDAVCGARAARVAARREARAANGATCSASVQTVQASECATESVQVQSVQVQAVAAPRFETVMEERQVTRIEPVTRTVQVTRLEAVTRTEKVPVTRQVTEPPAVAGSAQAASATITAPAFTYSYAPTFQSQPRCRLINGRWYCQ
jgi:hypothetical protein